MFPTEHPDYGDHVPWEDGPWDDGPWDHDPWDDGPWAAAPSPRPSPARRVWRQVGWSGTLLIAVVLVVAGLWWRADRPEGPQLLDTAGAAGPTSTVAQPVDGGVGDEAPVLSVAVPDSAATGDDRETATEADTETGDDASTGSSTASSTTMPASGSGSMSTSTSTPTEAGGSGVRPDCTRSCTLVLEGDSLTASLHDFLCVKVPAATCINSGAGGKRIDEMITSARSDVDQYADGDGDDVIILWAGINDLRQVRHSAARDPQENAEAIKDFVARYIAERRANGWDYIYVVNMPPSGPDIPGWEYLNTILNAADVGADELIDIAADPTIADPYAPGYKNGDGVHFLDEGGRYLVDAHLLPALTG